MAAGQGFKTFATGDVLTSTDVNGYLMQGVLVFASATARDASITSPQQGQVAFLKDTNVTTYYNGTAWANLITTGMTNPMTTTGDTIYSSSGSTPARLGIGSTGQVLTVAGGVPTWATNTSSSGLTLIGTTSFTSSSAVNVNSVFTSTYDNYKILVDLTGSTGMDVALRFRSSGTDNTNSSYDYNTIFAYMTTLSSSGASAASSFPKFLEYSASKSFASADILKPFASEITSVISNGNLKYAVGLHGWIFNGQFNNTTSFDGFSLIPSTGTITGKVAIYGYAK